MLPSMQKAEMKSCSCILILLRTLLDYGPAPSHSRRCISFCFAVCACLCLNQLAFVVALAISSLAPTVVSILRGHGWLVDPVSISQVSIFDSGDYKHLRGNLWVGWVKAEFIVNWVGHEHARVHWLYPCFMLSLWLSALQSFLIIRRAHTLGGCSDSERLFSRQDQAKDS